MEDFLNSNSSTSKLRTSQLRSSIKKEKQNANVNLDESEDLKPKHIPPVGILPHRHRPRTESNQQQDLNISTNNQFLIDVQGKPLDESMQNNYQMEMADLKPTIELKPVNKLPNKENMKNISTLIELKLPSQDLKNIKLEDRNKFQNSYETYIKMLKLKNPLTPSQLITIASFYLICIIVALPISKKGTDSGQCSLQLDHKFHIIYLMLVGLYVIFVDVSALLTRTHLIELQDQPKAGKTCCKTFSFKVITAFNIIGSACYIYEIYYDNLLFWMGIRDISNIFFGFSAIMFPFLNRVFHMILCFKLFILGIRSRKKTLKPYIIEETLIGLNLFHLSKLLYTHLTLWGSKRVLYAIIIKEFVLKALQISLKLVLVAKIFQEKCPQSQPNISIMQAGIAVNFISLFQLIGYLIYMHILRDSQQKSSEKCVELFNYHKENYLEIIITDKNADYMLKYANVFLYQQQRKIRSLKISFQKNKNSQLYKEAFLKQIVTMHQHNNKFKELNIFDTQLCAQDFDLINHIILSLPRLSRLHIQNCSLINDQDQCLSLLLPGITKKKAFKGIIIGISNFNREKAYKHIQQYLAANNSLSAQLQSNNIEEPELYDEIDIKWIKILKQENQNIKFFTLRACERIIYELASGICQNLILDDIDNYFAIGGKTMGILNTREEYTFRKLALLYLPLNKNLESVALRMDRNLDATEDEFLKFYFNEYQIMQILTDSIINQSHLKNLKLIGGVSNKQTNNNNDQLKFQIVECIQTCTNLRTLELLNINLNGVSVFKVISQNQSLSIVKMSNANIKTLEYLDQMQQLEVLDISKNQINLKSHYTLTTLLQKAKVLDISCNPLFSKIEINEDFKLIQTTVTQELNLKETNLYQYLSVIMEILAQVTTLCCLNLSNNQLDDECIKPITHFLWLREINFKSIDLSQNRFTIEIKELFDQNKVKKINITSNLISVFQMFEIENWNNQNNLKSLNIGQQQYIEPALPNQEAKQMCIKQFQNLKTLNLSYLRIPQNSIILLVKELLANHIFLKSIDLSGNDVGIQGCKMLNILVQRSKSLKEIKVDYANISCTGLTYLWVAFTDEDDDLTLDLLSVRGNKINIQWALRLNFKICQALKIRHLDLGYNQLGDKGAKELQVYFLKSSYLEYLDISFNSLSREGLRRIRELIKQNSQLKVISMKGNFDMIKNAEMCERRERYDENIQKIIYF